MHVRAYRARACMRTLSAALLRMRRLAQLRGTDGGQQIGYERADAAPAPAAATCSSDPETDVSNGVGGGGGDALADDCCGDGIDDAEDGASRTLRGRGLRVAACATAPASATDTVTDRNAVR